MIKPDNSCIMHNNSKYLDYTVHRAVRNVSLLHHCTVKSATLFYMNCVLIRLLINSNAYNIFTHFFITNQISTINLLEILS